MNSKDFEVFKAEALAAGFHEALVREYEPNAVIDTHSHGFDAHAVVTKGEMWLNRESGTQHLKEGDMFVLPNGTPHDERYGPQGATYWVARRNAQ